jgi:hypothetical protein
MLRLISRLLFWLSSVDAIANDLHLRAPLVNRRKRDAAMTGLVRAQKRA